MEANGATIERLTDIVEHFRLTDEGVKGTRVNKDAELLNVNAIVNDERYKKMLLIIQVLYVSCPRRTGITSYKIKHTLESILGEYVSNGWSILAFYHLEFPLSVNKSINASMKVRQQNLNNPILMKCIRKILNGEPVDIRQTIYTLRNFHLPLANSEQDRRAKRATNDLDDSTTINGFAETEEQDTQADDTQADDMMTMTTDFDMGWEQDEFTNSKLLKNWNDADENNL